MLLFLTILLGLGLAVLLLPVLIVLGAERAGPSGPVSFQLSWGFLLGGAGLQLRVRDQAWYLHPLVLGRHLPFPRLCLQGAGAGDEEALPPEPAPAPPPVPPPVPRVSNAQAVPAPSPEVLRESPLPPAAEKPSGKAGLGKLAGEMVRPGLRLLKWLRGTFHLRRLHLEGSFGLADPAATGQAFGYLQAVRGLLPRWLRLELSPDFVHQGVRGKAQLAIHFHLGLALYLVTCFGVRLAWRWWVLKKKTRRLGQPATTPSTRR